PIMDKDQLKHQLFTNNLETTAPCVFEHESRYLDMVTGSDPQVTMRPIFLVPQLLLSFAFAQMMAPLRSGHPIDTFMILNESKVVDPDADVVLAILTQESKNHEAHSACLKDQIVWSFLRLSSLDKLSERLQNGKFLEVIDDDDRKIVVYLKHVDESNLEEKFVLEGDIAQALA
ncbi:hypothetical protein BG006_004138, partial [Podila minutissima]